MALGLVSAYSLPTQAATTRGIGHGVAAVGLQLAPAPTDAVHPRNGRIAFSTGFILPDPDLSGHSQIYTVNPDGSDERQLTHTPDGVQAGAPDFSPDGTRIVYVDNRSGNFDIYIMRADGSGKHRALHTDGGDYFGPHWAPHGRRIIASQCHATPAGLYCDLVRFRTDGSHVRTLLNRYRVHVNPVFGPGGRRIAFGSDRAGFLGAVWVMRLADRRLTRLTAPNLEASWPQWSADGHHILFFNNCCRPKSDIVVMRADGSHVQKIVSDHPDVVLSDWGTAPVTSTSSSK